MLKGNAYQCNFREQLADGGQIQEGMPRIFGNVDIGLHKPLTHDAERGLPVAAATRNLGEADEIDGCERVLLLPHAIGVLAAF